jgi:hypothetical protein
VSNKAKGERVWRGWNEHLNASQSSSRELQRYLAFAGVGELVSWWPWEEDVDAVFAVERNEKVQGNEAGGRTPPDEESDVEAENEPVIVGLQETGSIQQVVEEINYWEAGLFNMGEWVVHRLMREVWLL